MGQDGNQVSFNCLNLPANNTICMLQLLFFVSDNSKLGFESSRFIEKLKPKKLFSPVM